MKIEDIEVGKIYKCKLSGNLILATHTYDDVLEDPSEIKGIYYNKVTGEYQDVYVSTGQLELIEEPVFPFDNTNAKIHIR